MQPLMRRVIPAIRRRIIGTIPRLPEAAGERGHTAGAEPSLRLAVLGESTAAGVGAATHEEALAGRLAVMVAGLTGRAVSWRAVAEAGATADRVRRVLVRDLSVPAEGWRADVVVLAVGVNDVVRWRPLRAWRDDITGLLDEIRHRAPGALVVASGLPPLERFPLLSGVLRLLAGRRARRLDRVLAEVAERAGHRHVPLPSSKATEALFSSDAFHPSPAGYRIWARLLALEISELLDTLSEQTALPAADHPG